MSVMTEQLSAVINEIEQYVANDGWDQQPRLFALVDTSDLVQREPGMAQRLGLDEATSVAGSLTPVEQDGLEDVPLDELLAQIGWPAEVAGCAIVHEVLVLPPGADAEAPDDPDEAAAWVAERPDRREVRMAVGVLRDGSRMAALRLRYDGATPALDGAADEMVFGPDLAPGLANALLETFED